MKKSLIALILTLAACLIFAAPVAAKKPCHKHCAPQPTKCAYCNTHYIPPAFPNRRY